MIVAFRVNKIGVLFIWRINILPPNVLIKVLADPRFGCVKDRMFVTSSTTIKVALPNGLDQYEFTAFLQKFNLLAKNECFITTFGAMGALPVKGLRPRAAVPNLDPLGPRPFSLEAGKTVKTRHFFIETAFWQTLGH